MKRASAPHSFHTLHVKAFWICKVILILSIVLLYIPLVTLAVSSFNPPEWNLKGYEQVFHNPVLWQALGQSLEVAFISTLISTVLGTSAALALERGPFRGRTLLSGLTILPLVMPEIIFGLSLLIWFVFLRLTLGSISLILAHTTFTISYVLLTVRTQLQYFDRSLEEAASDLGASPFQTFYKITLPLIRPGITSGALMAFAISFDDFLISFFTSGVGADTLPLKLYSMSRTGISSEVNALSTLMLALSLGSALILGFFYLKHRQASESRLRHLG